MLEGIIWININFHAIRALNLFKEVSGPYQEPAGLLYSSLGEGVVTNPMKEYQRTGYIWEQYNYIQNRRGSRLQTVHGLDCTNYPYNWGDIIITPFRSF